MNGHMPVSLALCGICPVAPLHCAPVRLVVVLVNMRYGISKDTETRR